MTAFKFAPINYWNKETMLLTDSPTAEQWKIVEDVCNKLDIKYSTESPCRFHPEKTQRFCVGVSNNYVDIQIQKSDTCMCHDIVKRMIEIRDTEMFELNPNHFIKDTK